MRYTKWLLQDIEDSLYKRYSRNLRFKFWIKSPFRYIRYELGRVIGEVRREIEFYKNKNKQVFDDTGTTGPRRKAKQRVHPRGRPRAGTSV